MMRFFKGMCSKGADLKWDGSVTGRVCNGVGMEWSGDVIGGAVMGGDVMGGAAMGRGCNWAGL